MKKRILFVYPPSGIMNREDRCQQPVKELLTIPPLPPADLMYLAAIARKHDFECKIRDYSIKSETKEDFAFDVLDFQPDFIVLNVTTPTLESDLSILKTAKEIKPDVVTIAKGAYFLTSNTKILDEHKELDLIIRGEVEETFEEIIFGRNYNDILGLTYRKNGHALNNKDRPFIDDLDKLPFPARDLIDLEIYRRPDNNKKQAVIKVSRGCPHHCFFCLATPVSGVKVRKRSIDNIVKEIKECMGKYGIDNFLFWSDVFNADREWTAALCQKIIDEGLKITWSSNTRADTADYELAKLMYKSGCRLVSIGIESGSQMMLDKMGKKTNLYQIRRTVKDFKKAGIKIYAYFILGLPWENEETAEETIKFAIELDTDYVNFYTATIFPGTRFWDYAVENKLLDEEERYKSAYYYPTVKTHHLSKERIFELHKTAVKRFYLRPSYIFKTLMKTRSPNELKNYFKAGMGLLFRR